MVQKNLICPPPLPLAFHFACDRVGKDFPLFWLLAFGAGMALDDNNMKSFFACLTVCATKNGLRTFQRVGSIVGSALLCSESTNKQRGTSNPTTNKPSRQTTERSKLKIMEGAKCCSTSQEYPDYCWEQIRRSGAPYSPQLRPRGRSSFPQSGLNGVLTFYYGVPHCRVSGLTVRHVFAGFAQRWRVRRPKPASPDSQL